MDDMAIATSNLSRSFGRTAAVSNLNLQVPKGSIYGFLGRNGAGKTTTIKMLLGLMRQDSGGITVLGHDPRKQDVQIRLRTGYVAENQKMYGWMTVQQTLKFVADFYPTWKWSVAEDFLERFELPKNARISSLSRGMQGKVALMLALAHEPELLVLDDCTSGLDAEVRREFLESVIGVIQEEGKTVFFSSHLIDEVERVADWIGIIQNGALRVASRTDDMKASVKQVRILFRDEAPEKLELDGILRSRRDGREMIVVLERFEKSKLDQIRKYPIESLDVMKISLEDIFLAYVGKRGSQ